MRDRGGNTSLHVAAVPQLVFLYKRVLQLVVAKGDPPARDYCPYRCEIEPLHLKSD